MIVREQDGYLVQRAIDVEQWHMLRHRVLIGRKHGGNLKSRAGAGARARARQTPVWLAHRLRVAANFDLYLINGASTASDTGAKMCYRGVINTA